MHYEGVPASNYYVIAEFASIQVIFGATVYDILLSCVFSLLTINLSSKTFAYLLTGKPIHFV